MMESSIVSDGGGIHCSLPSQPVTLPPSTPIHCSPPNSPCMDQLSPHAPQSVHSIHQQLTMCEQQSLLTSPSSLLKTSMQPIVNNYVTGSLINTPNSLTLDLRAQNTGSSDSGDTPDEEEEDDDDEDDDNVSATSDSSEERSKKRRKQINPSRLNESLNEQILATSGMAMVPSSLNGAFMSNGIQQFATQQQQQLTLNQEQSYLEKRQLFQNVATFDDQKKTFNESELKSQMDADDEEDVDDSEESSNGEEEEEEEEDEEEGLLCKYSNTLAGAASAVTKLLLANCEGSTLADASKCSETNQPCKTDCLTPTSSADQKQLNIVQYLAAAAAVATTCNQITQDEQRLHKCDHCSCPFLSTEHKQLYEQLQERDTKYEPNRLVQELQTILAGAGFEPGQIGGNNRSVDPMQFIKQLESSEFQGEENRHQQQALLQLLNNSVAQGMSSQMISAQIAALSQQNMSTNGMLSGNTTGRVFNPEAYCHLCCKEFCNKYFLKTHLANKHGLLEDPSTSSLPMTSASGSLQQSQLSSMMPQSLNGSVPVTSNTAPGNNLPHPLAAQLASQLTPQSMDGYLGMIRSTGAILNIEAYCEICCKEFCNKYFLKKHRQKVHGLTEPAQPPHVPTQLPIVSASTDPSNTNSAAALALQSMLSNANHLQQISAAMQAEQLVSLIRGGSSETLPNVTELAMRQFQQQSQCNSMLNNNVTGNSSSHIPNVAVSTAISGNNSSAIDSASAAPGELAQLLRSAGLFTPERLRDMGVINPEAFCEICCKEFCNKYFLKTHKANKHGIQTDSCDSSCDSNSGNREAEAAAAAAIGTATEEDGLEPGQRESGALSTADLTALLMFGQNNQKSTASALPNVSGGTTSTVSQTKDIGNCQESNSASTSAKHCELCGRSFSSAYFFKMHKFYSHQIPYASEEPTPSPQRTISTDQLDKNNNSGESESTDTTSALSSLQQQTELPKSVQHQQSFPQSTPQSNTTNMNESSPEDLLKLQHMLKELTGDESFENALLKNLAMLQQQQEQLQPTSVGQSAQPNQLPQSQIVQHGINTSLNNSIGYNNGDGGVRFCDHCNKEFPNGIVFKSHACEQQRNSFGTFISTSDSFPNSSTSISSSLIGQLNSSLGSQASGSLSTSLVSACNTVTTNGCNINANNFNDNNGTVVSQSVVNGGNNCITNQRFVPPTSLAANPLLASELASLTNNLPPNLPTDVSNSIFFSPTAGITLDPNNKQPKFVAGRNYCNICNKELCNKYFMKTHMMKMHRINIEEHPAEAAATSIVGGVMCDICQKELCSKYFLKVHKQNTHGIFEDPAAAAAAAAAAATGSSPGLNASGSNSTSGNGGNGTNGKNSSMSGSILDASSSQQALHQQLVLLGAAGLFGNNLTAGSDSNDEKPEPMLVSGIDHQDTQNSLYSTFAEVCGLCERRFKSSKWLRVHWTSEHSNELSLAAQLAAVQTMLGVECKPMCMFCGQMHPDRLSLHVHSLKEHSQSLKDLLIGTNQELLVNLVPPEDQANVAALLATTPISSIPGCMGNSGINSKRRRSEKDSSKKRPSKKPASATATNADKTADQATDLSLKVNLDASEVKKRKKNNDDQQQQATLLSGLASGLLAAMGAESVENQTSALMNGSNVPTSPSGAIELNSNDETGRSETTTDEMMEELDEAKLAALLSSSSLQQLLLAKSAVSNPNSIAKTSNRTGWTVYDELMQQTDGNVPSNPSAVNASLTGNDNQADPSSDTPSQFDASGNDNESFRFTLQQHLLQQLQQVQQQQKDLASKPSSTGSNNRKRGNSNSSTGSSGGSNTASTGNSGSASGLLNAGAYIKIYRCNLCSYSTRWLSNLYAHEKRRHLMHNHGQRPANAILVPNIGNSDNNGFSNSVGNNSDSGDNNGVLPSVAALSLQLGNLNNALALGQFGGIGSRLSSTNVLRPSTGSPNASGDLSSAGEDLSSDRPASTPALPSSGTIGSASCNTGSLATATPTAQYSCPLCPKAYRHMHSLQRHMLTHKSVSSPGTTSTTCNNNGLTGSHSPGTTSPVVSIEQPFFSTSSSDFGTIYSTGGSTTQNCSSANNIPGNNSLSALNLSPELLEALMSSGNGTSSLLGGLVGPTTIASSTSPTTSPATVTNSQLVSDNNSAGNTPVFSV